MKVLRAAFFLEFEGAQVDELVVIAELDDDFAKLQGRTVQHLIAARIRRVVVLLAWLATQTPKVQVGRPDGRADYESFPAGP